MVLQFRPRFFRDFWNGRISAVSFSAEKNQKPKWSNGSIASRQQEEGKKQAAVDELRLRADQGQDELRRLLLEVAAARDAKDALERRVSVRRQAARALQLAERAVAAETHALAWSTAAAAEQLNARSGGDADDDDDAHHDVVAAQGGRARGGGRGAVPRGEGAAGRGRGEAGGGARQEA